MKRKFLVIGLITAISLSLCFCSKDNQEQIISYIDEEASAESSVRRDKPDAMKMPELVEPAVTAEDLIQNYRDNVKSAPVQ